MAEFEHHANLAAMHYEHGFADWTDAEVRNHYEQFIQPDGSIDWTALHARDHRLEPKPHLSDAT